MNQSRLLSIIQLFFIAFPLFCSPASALEIHQNIRGPFTSGAEVTKACLKCHRQQAIEVLQSTHWTWVRQHTVNGKTTLYGKKDSLTTFAIDVSSNASRCMGCHVSNTRPAVDFDAPGPEMVDCLVCHDTTGTYRLAEPGVPVALTGDDLELMARNAGRPAPINCVKCHFGDCGLPAGDISGNNILGHTTPFQDIHMDRDTISLTCQGCHTPRNGHNFSRNIEKPNGSPTEKGCASCHTEAPHLIDQLNRHGVNIACQTCHIIQYAQNRPVMTGWNWIMTDKTNRVYLQGPTGRALARDENGFTSSALLEPVYRWDDGSDQVYTRGQRIRPQELTFLQRPSEKGPNSKIMPFRVIYGTQLYDTKYRYLISPLLQPTGPTFFPGSDWDTIAGQGMRAIVLPFSGQYSFAPTVAFRRVNHGVVPAAKALACLDCHGSTSLMPWQELGYQQDPWPASPQSNQENMNMGENTKLAPLAQLQ